MSGMNASQLASRFEGPDLAFPVPGTGFRAFPGFVHHEAHKDFGISRDTQKREVDLVVIRDGNPWLLVEAKHGGAGLSPHLSTFQKQTGAQHAFQISLNADYKDLYFGLRERRRER